MHIDVVFASAKQVVPEEMNSVSTLLYFKQ